MGTNTTITQNVSAHVSNSSDGNVAHREYHHVISDNGAGTGKGPRMHPSTYEYLKPTDEQTAQMAHIRAAAKAFSDVLDAVLPEGPDKTFIIRAHRSNAMWANVSITRLPDGTPRK